MASSPVKQPARYLSFFRIHSLAAYFGLAFLISWFFWSIEPALRARDPISATFFVQLGSYGPVLAAMIAAAIGTSEREHRPVVPRLAIAGLVLALAVFVNWPLIGQFLAGSTSWLHWSLLAVILILPAWVFFNSGSSLRGVHDLLGSLTRWRVNPLWYAAALFLMLFLSAFGVFLVSLWTRQPLSAWLVSFRSNPILHNLALTFFATALYGGPVGEEPGWRGFALPGLQKRFDPLLASVFLGLVWALWHLPLHVSGYYNQAFGSPLNGLLLRFFTTIPLTIIFTWLYNRSGGNLLVMVLLHTAVNLTSGLIAPGPGLYITTTVAVLAMVVLDRMYRKRSATPGDRTV